MHSLKLNKYDPVIHFATDQTLGAAVAVTNANGNIIARQNFDAWGRRRKVQDYSYLPQNTTSTNNGLNNNGTLPQWLYRGYTGHEMLDEFTLINMNARLYDQVLGLFLSPDKFISNPNNTQSYNRYAYCLNNPLKYTDPSGNIASLIAARNFSEGVNWMNHRMNGNKNYNYDHQFVMTGQMSNTWRNDPSIVRGPNGLPMGPNGEWSAFRDFGPSLENPGNAGRNPFTDATGLNMRLQHQYIGKFKGVVLKDKDGKIAKDINGKPYYETDEFGTNKFALTGDLIWIGSSYVPVGEDPNAWGSDFRGLDDAQSIGRFDDFTKKWDNANSTYGAPFNIAVGLVSEAAKQSATISTAQAFARKELSATLQFAKVAKYAGTASLIGNASQVLNAGYKFYQDPSLGNFTRVGVQFGIIGIEAGLNILLPGSGIMVGIGLNILESQYGDNLYNSIDGR